MRLSFLLPFCLLVMGFVACDEGNVDLDNTSEETLVVSIDELQYVLRGGEYRHIQLEPGRHSIIIKDEDGKIMEEATFLVENGGLINLARSKYLIWTDLYGDSNLRKIKLKEDWIDIGDESFYGEFQPIDQESLFLESEWDFGLNEQFPEDMMGWNVKDKYIIKRKLFREADLVEAYHSLVNKNKQ
ncbi:MAG: hypothetical protein AAFR61_22685 [Bacteroidota bacterium]